MVQSADVLVPSLFRQSHRENRVDGSPAEVFRIGEKVPVGVHRLGDCVGPHLNKGPAGVLRICHIDTVRNVTVTVWPDRIEWTRSNLFGRADTNTIMMRSVTGIRTHKSGLTYADVGIESGASSVRMRVTKAQAADLRRIVAEHAQQR